MGVYSEAHVFVVDLNGLSLGGCDVVLGANWLSTLGEILWDLKLLTMKF